MEDNFIPDYKGFTDIVQLAMDRVENPKGKKSYSYETFCNILDLQMDMHGIYDHKGDNSEDYYKPFALAVSSVIESLRDGEKHERDDYKEAFNTIKDLMNVYNINSEAEKLDQKTM